MVAFAYSTETPFHHEGGTTFVSCDVDRTVIWLRGEHDIATAGVLAHTLASASDAEGGDLIVDLRRVTFIDAATIGVLVRGRNYLREHTRDLTLRSPSSSARQVLEMCDLTGLIGTGR